MFTKRTLALVGSAAALALGMTGCATDPAATPSTVPTTVAVPTETPELTTAEPVPESTQAVEPTATEPTTAEPTTTETTELGTEPSGVLAHPSEYGPGAAACYGEDREPIAVSETGGAFDTSGVVQAWLCGDAPGGFYTVGPLEPLLGEHLEALIADYEALPPVTSSDAQEAANYVRLVFEFGDGTTRVIGLDEQDSTPVDGGAEAKQGSVQFYNTVRGHWYDQRQGIEAPTNITPAVMECPAPEYYIVNHPVEDVTAGWACQGGSEEFVTAEIDSELAVSIAQELRENSEPGDASVALAGPSISLNIAWGESIRLAEIDGVDQYLWMSDEGPMVYTPSEGLAEAVAQATIIGS